MIRKVMAVGASAAVAAGLVVAGAGSATAASGFQKVKAPKTVQAGQTFILKCKVAGNNAWTGADAYLMEKGAVINAHRTIASNGDCSFHVVLNATGTRKIRVVVDQNGGAIVSKWVKVNVQ
jgi:acyl dehydratase